jgi:hypothetical protein
VALHRALGDSNNFDRRRHREEVLQRPEYYPQVLITLERRAIRRCPRGGDGGSARITVRLPRRDKM